MTATEFLQLPEGPPYPQLIDGHIVQEAAPYPAHQIVVTALSALLYTHCREHQLGQVIVAPADVRFSESHVLQPDILYIAKRRTRKLIRKWIEGPPDLVIEILSDSTAKRDLTRKREIYRQHCVAEYWIVDLDGRTLQQIQFFSSAVDQEKLWHDGESFTSPRFPQLTIALADLFADL